MHWMTDEDLKLHQVFYPYAFRRQQRMVHSRQRFVHYTRAEAAMSIIKNRQVWMRKSSVMNDFMEVEHGISCLLYAYNGPNGDRFRALFETLHPGITGQFEEIFNNWQPLFRFETYLTSLSEHDDREDELGRLSMWRAYASGTGVALVLNPGVFFTPSDALHAYTSPVAYMSQDEFRVEFEALTTGLIREIAFLRTLTRDQILGHVFAIFRAAVLCTKHPGFAEEREWRIIYSPQYARSDRIIKEILPVGGVPQPVCKIPLEDIPEEGLVGASLAGLLNRIIIGPTTSGVVMQEAFFTLLEEAGVPDPGSKIWFSRIPLRVS